MKTELPQELVQEIETLTPPTAEEINQVKNIIKRGFARANNAPAPSADEIWAEFNTAWDAIAIEAEQNQNNQ